MTATAADRYEQLALIRRFEEHVLDAFPSGVFYGTTHTCIGQEADAVGVLAHCADGDVVVSNHRCHGHFLAYGGDPHALFAELMGKSTGVCGGRGGSQHLQWRNFYSNGILGGTVPLATGMALAERRSGRDAIAFAFMGDGTLGEGVVYEALNMAGLWHAPVLYVVEHNHVAQTTPTELSLAGSMLDRFAAFGIPAVYLDSSDVEEIEGCAAPLVGAVRSGDGPRALVIDTRRFGPHSKGDDPRPREDIAAMRAERDPLEIHASRLAPGERDRIDAAVAERITVAFERASADPVALVG